MTEVKKLFLILNNTYNGFSYDDIKAAIWHDLLQDIPFEEAQKSLRKHIKTSQYPPTIAEIIKPIKDPEHFVNYDQLKTKTDQQLQLRDSWLMNAREGLPSGTNDSA